MNLPDQDHLDKVILWISYAEELTPYAVTARYPGVDEIVTEDEAKQAVDMAFNVRETIRKVLVNDGMTIEEDTFK